MKRTVPLIITTVVGFVLIVAYFIPMTEWLGEFAGISFDILAAIAFILGGGNLLKNHLKKISDRKPGWGYSGVTIVAFLTMLTIGLGKIGVPPATDQEYYGESFAPLPLAEFPASQAARVAGALPQKGDGGEPPPSVRRQIAEEDGELVFRGWMRGNQEQDLLGYQDELQWQSTVEQLFDAAQPPEPLTGKVAYYAELGMLAFRGVMAEDEQQALLSMSDSPAWTAAVERIAEQSRRVTQVAGVELPEGVAIPASLEDVVSYDAQSQQLQITGPMSVGQRDDLTGQLPLSKPLSDADRQALLERIESLGSPLNEAQRRAFDKLLDGTWSVEQLLILLNEAGRRETVDKTAGEMLEELQAGVTEIEPTKEVGEDTRLNPDQETLLDEFASGPMSVDELAEGLAAAGRFPSRQRDALESFLSTVPTLGQRNKTLCLDMLRAGPLTAQQRDLLLNVTRDEIVWRRSVYELFRNAHTVKYPWSGDYGTPGSPFRWMYDYVFKPLTATMFSMLAFYVASAAFRAFRAKNVEAVLLLGTAFVILLGRTFAGVWLTDWLPESVSGLRIENISVFIMTVFNTAGNRAIMIGIALGIASTSLKVLLGIDRSYLRQQE